MELQSYPGTPGPAHELAFRVSGPCPCFACAIRAGGAKWRYVARAAGIRTAKAARRRVLTHRRRARAAVTLSAAEVEQLGARGAR